MTYLIWLEDGETEKKYVIRYNPELPVKKLTFWSLLKRLCS
jgi:hypothetical protein